MVDYYSILGVKPDSDAAQIRRAYIARAKVLHPDRFDRKNHPQEWTLANEMTAALNDAYDVLSDPEQRHVYDKYHHQASAPKAADRARENEPRQQKAVDLGNITAGHATFRGLSPQTRKRLEQRQRDTLHDQFKVCEQRLSTIYGFIAVPLVFLGSISYAISSSILTVIEPKRPMFMVLGLVPCILVAGEALSMLFQWRSSVLHPHFYVTPLYLIKTRYDSVSFWPLWTIKEVSVTHHQENGIYGSTDVLITSGRDKVRLQFSSRRTFDEFESVYRKNGRLLRAAITEGNIAYIRDNNDFAEVKPSILAVPQHRWKFRTKGYAVSVILCISFCAVIIGATSFGGRNGWYAHPSATAGLTPQIGLLPSTGERSQVPPRIVIPARIQKQIDSLLIYPARKDGDSRSPSQMPLQALPLIGSERYYGSAERIAPLEIRSSGNEHHLVKLVHVASGRTVMDFFVRAGASEEVQVPLGRYELRYASGQAWYGYTYLFGPTTTYSKAEQTLTFSNTYDGVTGFTVTLYKVQNGNLETTEISPEEF